MKLVNSKEEIDAIRPYKEHYNLTVYPKNYPAFVAFHEHDGGVCGNYYTMDILEIPKNIKCPDSFIQGVLKRENEIKSYDESGIFKRK